MGVQEKMGMANETEVKAVHKTEEAKRSVSDKVFLFGSATIHALPADLRPSLDRIKARGLHLFIGDDPQGLDRMSADYMRWDPDRPLDPYSSSAYEHVHVYSVFRQPRLRLEPSWTFHPVAVPQGIKENRVQSEKDKAMVQEADYGFAVFDPVFVNSYNNIEVSRSVLRNTVALLLMGKPVKFFYRCGELFYHQNLKTISQLEQLLKSYEKEYIPEHEASRLMLAKNARSELTAAQNKTEKILDRFHQILKSEKKHLPPSAIKRLHHSSSQRPAFGQEIPSTPVNPADYTNGALFELEEDTENMPEALPEME